MRGIQSIGPKNLQDFPARIVCSGYFVQYNAGFPTSGAGTAHMQVACSVEQTPRFRALPGARASSAPFRTRQVRLLRPDDAPLRGAIQALRQA
jgi:hypothetical protein